MNAEFEKTFDFVLHMSPDLCCVKLHQFSRVHALLHRHLTSVYMGRGVKTGELAKAYKASRLFRGIIEA